MQRMFNRIQNIQALPDRQLKLYCGQAGSDATGAAWNNKSREQKYISAYTFSIICVD
jgi:hypothetical protein